MADPTEKNKGNNSSFSMKQQTPRNLGRKDVNPYIDLQKGVALI